MSTNSSLTKIALLHSSLQIIRHDVHKRVRSAKAPSLQPGDPIARLRDREPSIYGDRASGGIHHATQREWSTPVAHTDQKLA